MSTKCWQPILRYFVWKNVHWCFWDATRILQTRAVHNLQKGTYSKYGSFRWLMKSTLCNLSLFAEKKSKKGSQPSLSWLVNYTLSHRHLILLYSLQIPNVDYVGSNTNAFPVSCFHYSRKLCLYAIFARQVSYWGYTLYTGPSLLACILRLKRLFQFCLLSPVC